MCSKGGENWRMLNPGDLRTGGMQKKTVNPSRLTARMKNLFLVECRERAETRGHRETVEGTQTQKSEVGGKVK